MAKQYILATIAIGAFCVGVLIYVFDRQPEFIYFLPEWLSFKSDNGSYFGIIGNHLPTFFHVYTFIILTTVITLPSIIKLVPICLSWLALDTLFEIAQIKPIAHWIASHVPGWFNDILFLENTLNYFILGTFDALDLLSIAIGTLAAYLTVALLSRRNENVTDKQHV